MMRPPPPPSRLSDPYPNVQQYNQSSFPLPPVSQRYLPPSRPGPHRPSSAASTNPHSVRPPPSTSTAYAQPQPQRSSNLGERAFLPLVHTQSQAQGRKGAEQQGQGGSQEEEQAYESCESDLPRPPPVETQLFGPSQFQMPTQRGTLIPDSSHRPRRPPRAAPNGTGTDAARAFLPSDPEDLLGDSLPPLTQPHRIALGTQVPDSHPGPQLTQREGAAYQLSAEKRVDTYLPPGPSRPSSGARPANPWVMEGNEAGARRSASVMLRPMTGQGGRGGSEARGATELFLAASQRQAQGGAKTNSEKIMEALTDWSTAILDRIATVTADQKQVRDQVHELQLGQRALATKEEVTEEITAQLSPALHEFFQTLHTKLDESVAPLPETTARLSAEKIRTIMMEIKQMEGSQRSQEESQEKPIAKLIDHLISKLDSVSRISEFLQSYKELPEALRDIAVYKQSMDTLTAMAENGSASKPHPPMQQAEAPIDAGVYLQLHRDIAELNQRLSDAPAGSSGKGAEGEQRILEAITTLARGLDRIPLLTGTQTAVPAQLQTDVLQLRAKVDSLSTDIRDIKAMLVQQHLVPQSTIDVANIVSQLKTAMLPNSQAMFASTSAIASTAEVVEFSQIQPTEMGTSQAYNYPTPASKDRAGRSSATAVSIAQFAPSFTTPSLPTLPAAACRPSAGLHFSNGKFGPPPDPTADVFGRIQPTSDVRTHLGSDPLGSGSLAVLDVANEDEAEVVDDFDDLFGTHKAHTAGPKGKGKGKRPSSGSGSGGAGRSHKKRVRTSTTVQPTPARVQDDPERKEQISTSQGAPSSAPTAAIPAIDANSQYLLDSQGYLLNGLKRSDRIAARRTISNNPIYDSSSPPNSGSSGAKRKSGTTKAVKHELLIGDPTNSLDSNPPAYPLTSSPGRVESQLAPDFYADSAPFNNPSVDYDYNTQSDRQGDMTLTPYAQPEPAPMKYAQKYSRRRQTTDELPGDSL